VSNPIIHQNLLLPLPIAMRRADRSKHALYFGNHLIAKLLRRKLDPRLNQSSILLRRQARILLDIPKYPALPFRNRVLAELLSGNLIPPLTESPLSELLNVALMHQRHSLASV